MRTQSHGSANCCLGSYDCQVAPDSGQSGQFLFFLVKRMHTKGDCRRHDMTDIYSFKLSELQYAFITLLRKEFSFEI